MQSLYTLEWVLSYTLEDRINNPEDEAIVYQQDTYNASIASIDLFESLQNAFIQ